MTGRPPALDSAIAASARRARALLAMQAAALAAVTVTGGRASCGSALTPGDAAPGDAAIWAAADDAGWRADAARAHPLGASCADRAACTAACQAGDARACVRLADQLRTGEGGPRDRLAARERYRAACEAAADPDACTHLALAGALQRDLDLAPEWIDAGRAPLGLLAAACTAGGSLACAALELIAPASPLAAAARAQACGGGAPPARCAARVAARACRERGSAEACLLAARAGPSEGAPLPDPAAVLDGLCRAGDPAACLYVHALAPAEPRGRDALLVACSDLGAPAQSSSIASACLASAQLRAPRRAALIDRACELGTCEHPALPAPSPTAVERSCTAGHPNACAHLIVARRATPASWAPVLDRLLAAQPRLERVVARGLSADETACRLGSLRACRAALARAPALEPTRARALRRYAELLGDPLLPPAADPPPDEPR